MISLKKQMLDYLIYIAIALALVSVLSWSALNADKLGVQRDTGLKWIGSIGSTLVIFGYFMNTHWKRLPVRNFLVLFCTLLIAHIVIVAFLWGAVPEIKGLWWGILVAFEIATGDSLIHRYGYSRPSN